MIVEIEFFNLLRNNFIIFGYFVKVGMVFFVILSIGLVFYWNIKICCYIISRGMFKLIYLRSERVIRY